MKIALTSKDFINIEIQLDKDNITCDTNVAEFDLLINEIKEGIQSHLSALIISKISENNNNNKKNSRFSNFDENLHIVKTNTFKEAITLCMIKDKLEKNQLTVSSGLPEIVRFKNSPYAYTIKSNKWSSPFGTEGTEVEDLLKDIAKNIYKLNQPMSQGFLKQYM